MENDHVNEKEKSMAERQLPGTREQVVKEFIVDTLPIDFPYTTTRVPHNVSQRFFSELSNVIIFGGSKSDRSDRIAQNKQTQPVKDGATLLMKN